MFKINITSCYCAKISTLYLNVMIYLELHQELRTFVVILLNQVLFNLVTWIE